MNDYEKEKLILEALDEIVAMQKATRTEHQQGINSIQFLRERLEKLHKLEIEQRAEVAAKSE